jgi:uncharacterized protein (DUF362 family)
MTDSINRRQFIAATAAALATASCTGEKVVDKKALKGLEVPVPNEAQRAKRRPDKESTVALVRCQSYEDDIFAHLKSELKNLQVPDLKGKRVVIKPNMVEFQPGHPITTDPAVLAAAVQLVDYLGAKEIIVAEGPGHMRDTEMLLKKTGLGPMIAKLGVPFVDLNLDDLKIVKIDHSFTGLKQVYMPKTIMTADAVISLPKLKTHHWMGATCSMKNLFGTVPGRKYGWPKNLLHIKGIPRWILDLQDIVKPQFAIVDAIIAMEGDGPINGTPKHTGFVAMGDDLAAVDATCIRTMTFTLDEITYIKVAGEVVGNVEENAIKVVGATIDQVKQPFARPLIMTDAALAANAGHQGG